MRPIKPIDVESFMQKWRDDCLRREFEKKEEIEERIKTMESLSARYEERYRFRITRIAQALNGELAPTGLHYWFRFDTWSAYEGLVLLCGFDPRYGMEFDNNGQITSFRIEMSKKAHDYYLYGVRLDGLSLDELVDCDVCDKYQASSMQRDFEASYKELLKLWNSGNHPPEKLPPKYFINWAIGKGLKVAWLEWAIEKGYYGNECRNTEKEVEGKSETAYLNIIGALCDLYWRATHPETSRINQSEIIIALESYKGFHGMSERNLKEKLSKGIKSINSP